MRTTLALSAFALITVLGAKAPAASHDTVNHLRVMSLSANDPDPSDCPFCGGNPAIHVQRLTQLERLTMALSTSLMR